MNKRRANVRLRRLWRLLQSPRLLFWLFPYFIGVILIGTIAQKYLGVFTATQLFFNTFIYWYGPFPIPVGASVLSVLFFNLSIYFITKSRWDKRHLGTTLAHLSILILLFGGAVTLVTKHEGFMILRADHPTHIMYDYHVREFAVYKNDQLIGIEDPDRFKEDKLVATQLPLTLRPLVLCRNCAVDDKNQLKKLPVQLDDEINQSGIRFNVMIDGEARTFVTTEFMDKTPEFKGYRFALRRKQTDIPFTLVLTDFTQSYYQGTDVAQSYQSSVAVKEKDRAPWPAQISMNNPLRYKGYTFYQASVLHLPNGESASVLNVVDNIGWLFPYLATFLLTIGLLLHLWERRHGQK